MRTTVRIEDGLLAEAKELAACSRRTLSSVLEDALREMLARRRQREHKPATLTTFHGSGLRPGVDLDDTFALHDLMDTADEASLTPTSSR